MLSPRLRRVEVARSGTDVGRTGYGLFVAVTLADGQRGELRLAEEIFASLAHESGADAVTVLDCGGGTGRVAVPIAQLGARVTVVDISVDALAALARRAAEVGVGDQVTALQGDVDDLSEAIGESVFDMAVVHGVLDAVDPRAALTGVRSALRPGGVASILVTNPAAGVLAKVLGGDLAGAVTELRDGRDLGADAIIALCRDLGFVVEQVRGVGVFAELIPFGSSQALTADGQSTAELLSELERLGSDRSPFREISARLHVVARRPLTEG